MVSNKADCPGHQWVLAVEQVTEETRDCRVELSTVGHAVFGIPECNEQVWNEARMTQR